MSDVHIRIGEYRTTTAEIQAVMDVCASQQLSPGPYVRDFEDAFAHRHGSRFGVMTNSGTDALRIALETLKEAHGWHDGDAIIIPAITFVATANVVIQARLTPVPVDVSKADYNMDPDKLQAYLESHPDTFVKGIIVVNLCGQPAELDRIRKLATFHGLKVIEDSCETMGVSYAGKSVGSWGDIGCFSFYMAHLMTTGVGGMAVTSNPLYENLMRSYVNHGRDPYYIPGRRLPGLSKELLKSRFKFDRIGFSCRPTEFEAAIGLCQLSSLDEMIALRLDNALKLTSRLAQFDLVLPRVQPNRSHAFMMFPIVLPENSKIDKFDLCLHLERCGIETRELLPLINQPCYAGMFETDEGFEVAKWINKNGFYIGCHQYMTDHDITLVYEAFDAFFRSH